MRHAGACFDPANRLLAARHLHPGGERDAGDDGQRERDEAGAMRNIADIGPEPGEGKDKEQRREADQHPQPRP